MDGKKTSTTPECRVAASNEEGQWKVSKEKMSRIEKNKQELMLLERSDKPREDVQLLKDNHPKL